MQNNPENPQSKPQPVEELHSDGVYHDEVSISPDIQYNSVTHVI